MTIQKLQTNIKDYFEIIDKPELKTSEILNKLKEKMDVYCYFDNKDLDKQFPPPKIKTVRYFKKVIEADEENANKSAEDLEREGVSGISLRERLLLELAYFNETGNHLDIDNITLCSGSRDSDGLVPSVYWNAGDRKLDIYSYFTRPRYGTLRTRAAVNLKSCSFNPSNLLQRVELLEKQMEAIKNAFNL